MHVLLRDPVSASSAPVRSALIIAFTFGVASCTFKPGASSSSGAAGHDGAAGGDSDSGVAGTSPSDAHGGSDALITSDGYVPLASTDGAPGDRPSDVTAEGPCVPVQCMQAGGQYCQNFPDRCGGIAMCGDCPKGQICGGGGIPHVCGGDPNCKPIPCSGPGYQFCGTIGDGCGKALNCGNCTAPKTCGGGGTDNVCGP